MVLEGASGPRGGLTALLRKVGRAGPNGQAYRALENPKVRFSRRLYTSFDADLKKVGDSVTNGELRQGGFCGVISDGFSDRFTSFVQGRSS